MSSKFIDKDVTYNIIGCAMEVHKRLGNGFVESVYEEALKIELKYQGVGYEAQKKYPITYRDQVIKDFYCDLVVADKVVLEFKAIKQLGDVERAQIINYLKVTNLKVGLLINYGEKSLKYERFVL
jgi:GxxExxY protein